MCAVHKNIMNTKQVGKIHAHKLNATYTFSHFMSAIKISLLQVQVIF